MIPASCAVVRASPLGRSRIRRDVSRAIRTVARATAFLLESGLCPTSTIFTSPDASSTCESSLIARMLVGGGCSGVPVEVRYLVTAPRLDVVLTDVLRDRVAPAAALLGGHRQPLVERLRLTVDVERIDRKRPFAEALVRAGVLRQDDHAAPVVDERRLLRNEVHAVEDRVHEQGVE